MSKPNYWFYTAANCSLTNAAADNLLGKTCSDFGFESGTLTCLADCLGFVTSECFDGPKSYDEDLEFYGDNPRSDEDSVYGDGIVDGRASSGFSSGCGFIQSEPRRSSGLTALMTMLIWVFARTRRHTYDKRP